MAQTDAREGPEAALRDNLFSALIVEFSLCTVSQTRCSRRDTFRYWGGHEPRGGHMAVSIDRRDLLAILAGAMLVLPRITLAEPNSGRRLIGALGAASPETALPQISAFMAGLQELGYQQGRDVDYVARWAYGHMDRLPTLAAELVELKPDIIFAAPTPAVVAAKSVTSTIPIVSFMLADEVRLGLVANDAHPGGNVTGILMRVESLPQSSSRSRPKQFPARDELVC